MDEGKTLDLFPLLLIEYSSPCHRWPLCLYAALMFEKSNEEEDALISCGPFRGPKIPKFKYRSLARWFSEWFSDRRSGFHLDLVNHADAELTRRLRLKSCKETGPSNPALCQYVQRLISSTTQALEVQRLYVD